MKPRRSLAGTGSGIMPAPVDTFPGCSSRRTGAAGKALDQLPQPEAFPTEPENPEGEENENGAAA